MSLTTTRSKVADSAGRAAELNPSKSHRFRPDIEGMRAVAVMLVVADHLKIPGFKGGFLGVDVFFVISGFLITFLLSNEFERNQTAKKAGWISITDFYVRRARRILPASLLVIASVLIAANLLFNVFRFQEVQSNALWATFFLANLDLMRHATDYFAQGNAVSPLQNYWSLAVEEQFYIVWPLVFMLAARLGWSKSKRDTHNWRLQATVAILVITGASLLWSLIATNSNPAGAYFSPFTRAYELGIGATVAILAPVIQARMNAHISRIGGLAGLALLAIGLVVLGPSTPYPGLMALIPTVGAALLIIAGLSADSPNPAGAALSVAPARFLGRISYSLYLWHWPIIVFAVSEYPGLKNPEKSLILLPLMILVSWLSYRFVEQPFRTLGKGTGTPLNFLAGLSSNRDRIQLGAMTAVALVAFGSIAAYARPLPSSAESSTLNANITKWANWDPYAADQTASNGDATNASGAAGADNSAPSDGPTPERIKLIEAGLRVKKATPAQMARIADAKNNLYPGTFCTDAARTQSQPPDSCTIPTTGGDGSLDELKGKNVVLVGNSYVAMWSDAIAGVLPKDANATSLAVGSCVPYDFGGKIVNRNEGGVDCSKWAKWEVGQVKRLKPALVVISSIPKRDQPVTFSAVTKLVKSLQKTGSKVLWIGSVPQAEPWDTCVGDSRDISKCTITDFASNANDPSIRAATEAAGAKYWEIQPLFCTSDGCPTLLDGKPVRTDGTHLTPSATNGVKPQLTAAIHEALGIKNPGR